MRVGISGTHGTGKTTLAGALCACLPGHVTADEPYYLLEEEGYEFGFPPSSEDYRALLELVYDNPLNAWEDIPVLELTGPLDGRLDAVLAALGHHADSA